MAISDRIKNIKAPTTTSKPVWTGPDGEGPNGGITFSMICKWLNCRDRARVMWVENLRSADRFNHRIEYGNMWHGCEEAWARNRPSEYNVLRASRGEQAWSRGWEFPLQNHTELLCKKYMFSQEEICHWASVCTAQFPIYLEHWAAHPDNDTRESLLQEQVFDVPYTLPSGRVVRLRGKWDSVDLIKEGHNKGVWVQENKTKGDVDTSQIAQQMRGDLQSMLYLIALGTPKPGHSGVGRDIPGWEYGMEIRGVRYNVVRRPLSGGTGSIRQHKPTKKNPHGESREEFYGRLGDLIRESPGEFFYRWNAEVTADDLAEFRRVTFDPLLEQVCVWSDWVLHRNHRVLPDFAINYRHPFGATNFLDNGGSSELDEYLLTGSKAGLRQVTEMFTELK